MKRIILGIASCALLLSLSACETPTGRHRGFPDFELKTPEVFAEEPAVIRQPVLPEMLVNCRGHVLVPALGMHFVMKGKEPPKEGQYVREEHLTPPYRIIPAGARVSSEQSPARLNVELDKYDRIIGLYCG